MEPELELKPNARNRIAPGLIGALVLLVALVGAGSAHGQTLLPFAIVALIGALLIGLAIRLGARRVRIGHDGIEAQGMFGRKRMAWSDVASYSFVSLDPYRGAYAQGGLAGVVVVAAVKAIRAKPQNRKFGGGRLQLIGRDGSKLTIAPWFQDIDTGLDRIFGELHARLGQTGGTDFGKLAFDGQALHHASKGALPLTEIEKVVVTAQGVVSIRKVGKRLAWGSVAMAKVSRSMLLFEQLAAAGVVVEIADVVFLPLPTLHLLSRIATARANLPQARIHHG